MGCLFHLIAHSPRSKEPEVETEEEATQECCSLAGLVPIVYSVCFLTHPGLPVQGVSNPEGQALLHQLPKEMSYRLVWQRCIFSIVVPSSQMTPSL